MSTTKVGHKSKLSDLIHYRIRAITVDGRAFVGELMAFDAHMNLVLAECVEHRIPEAQMQDLKRQNGSKEKKEAYSPRLETRPLGLVVLRGEQVLTTVVESAPAMTKKQRALAGERNRAQLAKHKRKGKGVVRAGVASSSTLSKTAPRTPAGANPPGTDGFQQGPAHQQRQPRPFQPPPGFRRR
ncbi:LAMI_0D02850g1_1 [Lachancea mirantina]|uniref:Sm protein B n=1 Tax=Lachancea mirantina TaxID=1230905 RepID=A0A1G4JA34_9SACH|nr:LAMI_0D02850g1_1 [Lachancea mirantina]